MIKAGRSRVLVELGYYAAGARQFFQEAFQIEAHYLRFMRNIKMILQKTCQGCEHKYGSAIVLDNDKKVLGIFTVTDALRALSTFLG